MTSLFADNRGGRILLLAFASRRALWCNTDNFR